MAIATSAAAQRPPAPPPPPQQQQRAEDRADRQERLRRNVEGSDAPEGTKRRSRMLVPAAFQGEWNADLKACGTGHNASRLIVGGDSLRFYESLGTVRRVAVESPTLIAVTADMAGEGSRWTDTVRLELTGPDVLAVVGSDGPARKRCPQSSPAGGGGSRRLTEGAFGGNALTAPPPPPAAVALPLRGRI